MTGYEPDRDALARVSRVEMFIFNCLGAVLLIAAFFTALYVLDLALTRGDRDAAVDRQCDRDLRCPVLHH